MDTDCRRAVRSVIRLALVVVGAGFLAAPLAKAAPDAAFSRWLEGLWPKAQSMGVSRKTFSAAIHGLEPDLTLPDLELPGRKGGRRAGRPNSCRRRPTTSAKASIARLAARGKKLAAEHRATLAAIEQKFGVPPQRDPGDLGPRDRLWRAQASAQRHPRAGDAGLLRPPQGDVHAGIPLCAADPGGGPRQARRYAQLLGRRHGTDAVPAVGVLQARASISMATAAATSGPRCRTRLPPRRSSSSTRAGSPARAGPTKCARRPMSTAPSACRSSHHAGQRMA